MAAAPADFRPRNATDTKISRAGEGIELDLEPTEDILAELAARRTPGQTIVGFAAEHGGDSLGRARSKLARKAVDMIVLNDVSDPEIGFESERNAVTLVEPDGETEVAIDSKQAVAEAICDRISKLRASSPSLH